MNGVKKDEFKESKMGKYPLSDKEKQRIMDMLENTKPSEREVFLRNAASFAKWLAGACYDIYVKVKDFFSGIGEAIGDFIDWLFD